MLGWGCPRILKSLHISQTGKLVLILAIEEGQSFCFGLGATLLQLSLLAPAEVAVDSLLAESWMGGEDGVEPLAVAG